MPIYEYRCNSCSHELEVLQKINDEMLVDCPECGQPALKRLVSAAAFRLKGSGWYETDFKKDNKRNLAQDSGKEPPETKTTASDGGKTADAAGKNGDNKTEAKPAAKPDAKAAAAKTGA